MALWGNKDKKAVTGTIAVTEDSVNVVGTNTLFTTELKAGNVLDINNVEYQIDSIQSNIALKLKQAYADSTASSLAVDAYEKPAYLAQSELGDIYGISASEVSTDEAKNVGINTTGWGKYTTYVDGNGRTRHKFESLVAMGTISGDAGDDNLLPESGTITIDTQPVDDAVAAPAPGMFTVVASIDTDSSLTYQWQEFDGVDWVELTGEDSATFTTEATTSADDSRQFRVIVMAAGADSVTSDVITLTVTE